MSKREPKQERGESSRNSLLVAALELVAERGISGLTHRAVAQRANVSYGMVGYFYDSLDDLMIDAVRRNYAARVADYQAMGSALADAEFSAADMAGGAAEVLTSSTLPMLLAHFEVYLHAARDQRFRDELKPIFRAMHEVAVAVAAQIGVQDRERFAQAVIALVEGNQLRRVAEGIEVRDELAHGLRILAIGALALEADPGVWESRLAERPKPAP
jgi:DNA-binding transcriptional regulator YbjK